MKAQALRMTSRGNDLSSAAAVLFVLKKVMYVYDDPLAYNQFMRRGEMVTANKDWRG